MIQRTILDVDWIVLEETALPAVEPVIASAQPAAPEPQRPAGDAPAIRPWAKPLLTGVLILAGLWLAGLALIIFDGALFADASVRQSLVFAGIPILCLIAIAIVADPDHESNQETYRTWGREPVGQCTPSRANTLTGRGNQ